MNQSLNCSNWSYLKNLNSPIRCCWWVSLRTYCRCLTFWTPMNHFPKSRNCRCGILIQSPTRRSQRPNPIPTHHCRRAWVSGLAPVSMSAPGSRSGVGSVPVSMWVRVSTSVQVCELVLGWMSVLEWAPASRLVLGWPSAQGLELVPE